MTNFPNDLLLAFVLYSLAHDGVCNAFTDKHYHLLALCSRESHRRETKSYSLPCLYTNYGLLKSNSHETKVFGELFKKSDQAISYNGDLQSIAENKNPRKFLPSIYFSVQKCDKVVQANCGLSQALATFGKCYVWSRRRSCFNFFSEFSNWSWFYKFCACTNVFSE